ncbi:MAG TPA: hypothetical protein DCR43_07305 [Bacteroidales bacterium]|nr:MAG: hypothetical protein A2X11_07950 [Bacteroidetes bacterium GWE2_42_24]OFY26433.1 MAG: hypothetical protein A2X09_02005 [Bacteroidetes bacterium GWF2_43_11]HAQ65641.1 hypothetical protein [Bacteroidales bacterium]HBZ68168.1 hypothetical protein [Bacteroidales bacterium]
MKQNRLSSCFFLILFFALAVLLQGCEKTDEETTPTDIRTDYTGTWISTESAAKNSDATYTVKIELDGTNSSQVILKNYMNLGSAIRVYAVVTETTITVPLQTVDSWAVAGSGSLVAEGEIRWSSCRANQLNVTAVYRRQ